jgi:hypothetical protein
VQSADFKEGVAAFFEKRPAHYKGLWRAKQSFDELFFQAFKLKKKFGEYHQHFDKLTSAFRQKKTFDDLKIRYRTN